MNTLIKFGTGTAYQLSELIINGFYLISKMHLDVTISQGKREAGL